MTTNGSDWIGIGPDSDGFRYSGYVKLGVSAYSARATREFGTMALGSTGWASSGFRVEWVTDAEHVTIHLFYRSLCDEKCSGSISSHTCHSFGKCHGQCQAQLWVDGERMTHACENSNGVYNADALYFIQQHPSRIRKYTLVMGWSAEVDFLGLGLRYTLLINSYIIPSYNFAMPISI